MRCPEPRSGCSPRVWNGHSGSSVSRDGCTDGIYSRICHSQSSCWPDPRWYGSGQSVGGEHMDQSNHKYYPLRTESRALEMGRGLLADGSAGSYELLVTPPHLPAGSLPVSPSPIAQGLSVTDSTRR